jgi:hypothetical protein
VVLFFEEVVVAAGGGEVVFCGWSAVGPAGEMVEVAVDCWHAAAGEDTGLVAGLDVAA